MIREVQDKDGPYILEIYEMGLAGRMATFETEVPAWISWKKKFLAHSRFVFLSEEKVVGWVGLSPVSERAVYKGVAEISIYVHTRFQGMGIGSALLEKVINSSEDNGLWTLQSSVFPENLPTINLHLRYGFRIIGKRNKIGRLDNCWKDTLLLERRSNTVV